MFVFDRATESAPFILLYLKQQILNKHHPSQLPVVPPHVRATSIPGESGLHYV
jgi:hypothetical protein